jgi:hypothetical protein
MEAKKQWVKEVYYVRKGGEWVEVEHYVYRSVKAVNA